jgi:hypothetical protein
VYEARYDAVEQAIAAARLREAPVAVALCLYVEGIIAVNRKWPAETSRLLAAETIRERRRRLIDEVDLFLRRATDEGLLQSDLPPGWVGTLLPPLMRNTADELPELSAVQAANVMVGTLLRGVGAHSQGRSAAQGAQAAFASDWSGE